MSNFFWDIVFSGWLGILCAISPCPLACNIAAVGFLTRQTGKRRQFILYSLLYVLGRMATYVAIGMLLVSGIAAAPGLSYALQKYMALLMGPLILLVSVVLLNLIEIKLPQWLPNTSRLNSMLKNFEGSGSFVLGMIFALNFCPTSAALFFGSLLPVMVKSPVPLIPASSFGLATGIPMICLAMLLTFSSEKVGTVCKCLTSVQEWIQKGTGILFLVWGLWMTLKYTMKIF